MRNKTDYPDQIIERAAAIWARALRRPEFDNGDTSSTGGLAGMMASMNAASATPDDLDTKIDAFETILADRLKWLREHDGEKTGEIRNAGKPNEWAECHYFTTHLNVDYGPCAELAWAADRAGIPASLFSWKSSVDIQEGYVSARFGYGAGDVNHYPMPDGRWLLTDLRGTWRGPSDMEKIIAAVAAGTLTGFEVEAVQS